MAAAVAIADEDGLDAVSIRRVAQRLGTGAMTLYWHVESKDDLVALMLDATMAEQLLPTVPPGWRTALTAIAHQTLAVFERHPWLADGIGRRPIHSPNAMGHVEQSLSALAGLGLRTATVAAWLNVLDDFVIGFAVRERRARPVDEAASMDEEDWARLGIDRDVFPHLVAAAADGFRPPGRERFAVGLDLILDGIGRVVDAEAGGPQAAAP